LTCRNASPVLWARSEELASEIAGTGVNSRYLPDFPLPTTLQVTSVLEEALTGA
jgi:glycerol-3-phosphate dehydrogenase (NAD(P)+)